MFVTMAGQPQPYGMQQQPTQQQNLPPQGVVHAAREDGFVPQQCASPPAAGGVYNPIAPALLIPQLPPQLMQQATAVVPEKKELRKGKWLAEEEEYTARIIHHFNTGVLRLPEGTTLRAFLAKNLDCDPMRITKKFTRSSCLGKRVYHNCEKTPATLAEIAESELELRTLEARFHARLARNRERRIGAMDTNTSMGNGLAASPGMYPSMSLPSLNQMGQPFQMGMQQPPQNYAHIMQNYAQQQWLQQQQQMIYGGFGAPASLYHPQGMLQQQQAMQSPAPMMQPAAVISPYMAQFDPYANTYMHPQFAPSPYQYANTYMHPGVWPPLRQGGPLPLPVNGEVGVAPPTQYPSFTGESQFDASAKKEVELQVPVPHHGGSMNMGPMHRPITLNDDKVALLSGVTTTSDEATTGESGSSSGPSDSSVADSSGSEEGNKVDGGDKFGLCAHTMRLHMQQTGSGGTTGKSGSSSCSSGSESGDESGGGRPSQPKNSQADRNAPPTTQAPTFQRLGVNTNAGPPKVATAHPAREDAVGLVEFIEALSQQRHQQHMKEWNESGMDGTGHLLGAHALLHTKLGTKKRRLDETARGHTQPVVKRTRPNGEIQEDTTGESARGMAASDTDNSDSESVSGGSSPPTQTQHLNLENGKIRRLLVEPNISRQI